MTPPVAGERLGDGTCSHDDYCARRLRSTLIAMGDEDRYEQLSRVATDRVLAWREAHPEDGDVVDRVPAFRAEVWEKRLTADRAARAAAVAAETERQRRAAETKAERERQATDAKAERRRRELAALGPGRCPHGNLLEACDHLTCAPDPDEWVRRAKDRSRYFQIEDEVRRRMDYQAADLEDKDG
jgi:hypothetical protein